jgi:hypothetical protein
MKLVYLLLYSPDLNPIEEFFVELKTFIKRYWQIYEADLKQGFVTFLEWCIDEAGGNKCSARGHFRHAGLGSQYIGDSHHPAYVKSAPKRVWRILY